MNAEEKSALDNMVDSLHPLLKHINMHRFLWLFTCVCAFIAWNRGLMLLYALVAFLIAVLLVSYIYWFFNLNNIHIKRELPQVATAKQSFTAVYHVNVKGHKHFLSMQDDYQRRGHPSIYTQTAYKAIKQDPSTGMPIAEEQHAQFALTQPLFFTHIHDHATVSVDKTIYQRGVYMSDSMLLSCAYPLGIIQQTKTISLPVHKLYVLPETFDIDTINLGVSHDSSQGQFISQQHGSGDDITGLRQYHRGDPLKMVHWSASAKQISRNQPWLSKQLDSNSKPAFIIVLNQFQCREQNFETMLSIAASFAKFTSQQGFHCYIVGLTQHHKGSELANGQQAISALTPWYISVPIQDTYIEHNLIKLAKANWLTGDVSSNNLNKTSNQEKQNNQGNVVNSGSSSPQGYSYTNLVAEALAQHAQTNTVVTFSPFNVVLPHQKYSHLAFTFSSQKHADKVSQSFDGKSTYHYHVATHASLQDIAALFTAPSQHETDNENTTIKANNS